MNILALDLGTTTGYAYGDSKANSPSFGHWRLGTAKEIKDWGQTRLTRRSDPRVFRLFLKAQNISPLPDLIVFEDVQFQTFTYQTQLWASFRAAIWCAFPTTVIDCVPVGTLKMFATGNGRADKKQMIDALLKLSGQKTYSNITHDEADAVWLWYWAKKHIVF